MMFVTDLTAFAENGFYGIDDAIYVCMCDIQFLVKIARGQSFHVKCDDCGQLGVVSTEHGIPGTDPIEPFLKLVPIFVLEGSAERRGLRT